MNTSPFKDHAALIALGVSAALAIGLLVLRILLTGSGMYLFLVWNLFLAFIPLFIAMVLVNSNTAKQRLFFYPLLGLWLLFLPNAPYILTDLLHFRKPSAIDWWYDLVMILTFAMTALSAGFRSIRMLQSTIVDRFAGRAWVGWSFAVMSLFASAYGIFLGRFLRWNSWDVVDTPQLLARDIFHSLTKDSQLLQTYGFTLIFGSFLTIMYLFQHHRSEAVSS